LLHGGRPSGLKLKPIKGNEAEFLALFLGEPEDFPAVRTIADTPFVVPPLEEDDATGGLDPMVRSLSDTPHVVPLIAIGGTYPMVSSLEDTPHVVPPLEEDNGNGLKRRNE